MISTLTTWDNATVGAGTTLNRANMSTTPEVRFNDYHDVGNRICIERMTYPTVAIGRMTTASLTESTMPDVS
jgi:hypothetical protein